LNVLSIQGKRRYFGALSNVKTATNKRKLVVQQRFEYTMQELNQPFMFRTGLVQPEPSRIGNLI
jgi:hypothetical protein